MKKKQANHSVQLRTHTKKGSLKSSRGAAHSVFAPSAQSPLQSFRFESFLKVLGSSVADLSSPLRVGLCCLAYEGICTLHEFHTLLGAVTAARPAPLGARVSMSDADKRPNGYQVRLLSARTLLALSQLEETFNPTKVVEQMSIWLNNHYPQPMDFAKGSALEQVLLDASAWLYLCLPGAMYAYVRKELAITALPDSVFARLQTREWASGTNACESIPSGGGAVSEDALLNVDEIALEHALAPPDTLILSLPTRTIGLLKQVCSVPGGGSHIRVADHLARQQVQRLLAGSAELHHDEGHVSGVLVSWVMALFSTGSLQRRNPAISTVSAYIDALIEPLARNLVELQQPLVLLDSEQWRRLFEELGRHAGPHAYGPALATFHLWAVDNYGCDPMLGIIFNKVDEIKVHANVIWPHEREELLHQAGMASMDRRVNEQVRAMAALGSAGLFRIGDLMPLQVSQIIPLETGLQVCVDPARKWHKGKGTAPRRTVFIPAGYACDLINAWAESRRKESFNDDALLFGDPNQRDRLYRFSHCTQLLNRLLKQVTGDDTVSFHTLRHTSAGERTLALLHDSAQSYAISPLDELQYSMGHSTRYTLWTTYFHFPEFVIRHCIDDCAAVQHMEEKEAAFWLKGTTGTLRKAKSRAAIEGDDEIGARFFHSKVQQTAQGQTPWRHAPGHPVRLAPPLLEPAREHHVRFDLKWVTHALRNILEIDDPDVCSSRMSCLPSHLQQLGHAVAMAAHPLDPLTARKILDPLLPGADPATCMAWTRHVLLVHKLRLDFDALPNLPTLLKFASAGSNVSLIADATRAWVACKRNQAISLTNLHAAAPLVKMILGAQVPASCLIARLQIGEFDKAKQHVVIEDFAADWINVFGTEIPVEVVETRRSHPKHYLVVRNHPHKGDEAAPPASTAMHGIHGFFFCLAVLQHLNNSEAC